MIGILLITHGCYGETLVQNACHVLNRRPPGLAQLGVAPQDDPLDLLPVAQALCASLDSGDGVLLLTDLYGATPANLTMKLRQRGNVVGLAGVNLPMLLAALTHRDKDLKTALTHARDGGRAGILNLQDH
jgi:PTS system ascorbate-specific IIA component